jgi:hypothetical protein
MSSFVRVGIKALVAANLLCDQPLVTREIIVGLVVAHLETGYSIVDSRYC